MALGYSTNKAFGFCTKYMTFYPHSMRRVWDADKESRVSGEVVQGSWKRHKLIAIEIEDIHEYVITHSIHTSELYR